MNMRKMFANFLIITMLFSVLSGCGGKTENGVPVNEQNAEQKREDVVLGVRGEPLGFDPTQTGDGFSNTVELQLFDGLVQYDENRNIVGNLATDWNISDDGLVYTFDLKEGVKFHDGTELTAEDVKYSLDLAKESPFTSSLNKMESITVLDPYKVEIKLKEPYVIFLEKLCRPDGAGIISKNARESAGAEAFYENPVGTGPYVIKEWERGSKVILERFEDYHWGAAPIKEAVFRFLPEPTTATIAVESGEVDFTDNISAADIPAIDKEKVSIYESPSFHFNYLVLNTNKEPLNNVKVRQAIAHAIDKDSVAISALEGYATVVDSVVRKDAEGYSDSIEYRQYDVDKAKELLKEAGYEDGFKLQILITEGYSNKIAEMVQANLKEINIDVSIQSIESSAFIQDMVDGKHEMGWFAVDNSTTDASQVSTMLETGEMYNLSYYSNTQLDEALHVLNSSINPKERNPKAELVQKIVNDEVPIIPLFWRDDIFLANKQLKNVEELFVQFNVYKLSW